MTIVESDYETDYENANEDFSLLNTISPKTGIVNGIEGKDKDNVLSKRDYLKLLFSSEVTAKKVLIKRASQFWWLNKSEKCLNGGSDSSHFAIKR